MDSLCSVQQWPVDTVAVAVVDASGAVVGSHGPQDRPFRLASVTKLLSAYAMLLAVEEGAVDSDQPAGPPGSTVRHLLAHTSGLAFDSAQILATPSTKRIYSNTGFAVLADTVAAASGIRFADYLAEGVLQPLGMAASRLEGPAGYGAVSTCPDLARFAAELQAPTLLDPQTLDEQPDSPETFGHFGQSGTFLWVDPVAGAACVALTTRDFGPWARNTWPAFSDRVLADLL